jgi:hypothetical protein
MKSYSLLRNEQCLLKMIDIDKRVKNVEKSSLWTLLEVYLTRLIDSRLCQENIRLLDVPRVNQFLVIYDSQSSNSRSAPKEDIRC